ncbi:MAG: TIR domain-containing protein [Stenomitos rutilans HA7619-LM2]|jgi:WD40 repeat protein|nr:TIR domain-containing protein [Stenomitos rutilans HA7619-LM2]
MADVFISYSRKDKDFVKALHTALAQCDRDAWVDWEDIPLTADWWQEIERGIEAADTFVFVVSPDSTASRVCNQELDHAVQHHKRLVPVVRRDDFERQQAHEALRRHNWLFFREEDDFDCAFQSLLEAIDMDLEHVHAHTRLLVRAIEWDSKGQDDSFLLRGSDLKSASRWLSLGTDKDPKPTALQTQYILASGKAEIQRQRRTSLISSVGFVGALALALLAVTQYHQAKQRQLEAEKGQLLALSASASANLASNKDIEALIDGVKVGQQLQRHQNLDANTRNQAMTALQRVTYGAKERSRLEGHSDYVRQISFSPDGKTLVTSSDDGTVKLWKLDGTLLNTFKQDGYAYAVSFSPDGKTIATSNFIDSTIKLWALNGKLLKTFKRHQDSIFDLAFNPDGRVLASASGDRTVMLWDVEKGTRLKTLSGHHDEVNAVRFSPDGRTLASSSNDRTIKLWTLDGTLLRTLRGHRGQVNSISFSPDGKTIATGAGDQTVKLWALDGALLRTLKGHTEPVSDARFSPDGKTLATASVDNTIKLWKPDGTLLTTLKGHSDWITNVRFSPDGQTLASGSGDGTVKLWQLKTNLLRVLEGTDSFVYGLAFSPDGQVLETGDGNVLTFWRLQNGTMLKRVVPHANGINDVSISTNGSLIATTGDDKTIKLWNWDGTLRKTLIRLETPTTEINFGQDDQAIAALIQETKTLIVWNMDGKVLKKVKVPREWLEGGRIGSDLQTLATPSGKTVKLWQNGKPGAILKGHTADVTYTRFSADGQTIATTSWDRTIKLWTRDGKLISTLKGHTGGVTRAVISRDNQLVVSSGDDKTVRLWKRDGTLLMTLQTENVPRGADFSRDGQTIAFGSGTATVLWNIADLQSPQALTQRDCTLLQNYLITHPNVLLDLEPCQNDSNLVPAATNLANANDVAGAVTLFRRAVQRNPNLTLNPEVEAKTLADRSKALRLVEEGQDLALDEKINGAVAKFQAALKLNPQLTLTPTSEAQTLAAKGKSRRLIDEGRTSAYYGDITAAIAHFKQALQLNPGLAIEPEVEAKFHQARGLIDRANSMVRRGEIKPAIALYNQAEAIKVARLLLLRNWNWNYLCGSGSVQDYATAVMPICEKVVATDPDNGEFHDSRGVARAMTGDFAGAIEDFQVFVNWTEEDDRRTQRQRWINKLQQGNNPFTPQELQKLKEKELL